MARYYPFYVSLLVKFLKRASTMHFPLEQHKQGYLQCLRRVLSVFTPPLWEFLLTLSNDHESTPAMLSKLYDIGLSTIGNRFFFDSSTGSVDWPESMSAVRPPPHVVIFIHTLRQSNALSSTPQSRSTSTPGGLRNRRWDDGGKLVRDTYMRFIESRIGKEKGCV